MEWALTHLLLFKVRLILQKFWGIDRFTKANIMGNLFPINITCDLTPLIQSIPNGVNKIFDLAFGKSVTQRQIVNKLLEAQAERQSRLIIEGKASVDKNGNFIDHTQVAKDNTNECIEYAISSALNRQDEPSCEEISKTFFNKWRESAQHIDEQELKEFWGRVLTEEIYTPNSINLRVLNTLSMLSLEEAKFFTSTLKYIIFDRYLILDFIPENMRHPILDTLYNMGAISHIPQPGIKSRLRIQEFNSEEFNYYFFYQQNQNYCFAFHFNKDKEKSHLAFELIELTSVGESLYKLAHNLDENTAIELAKEINIKHLKESNIESFSLYEISNNSVTKEILSKS